MRCAHNENAELRHSPAMCSTTVTTGARPPTGGCDQVPVTQSAQPVADITGAGVDLGRRVPEALPHPGRRRQAHGGLPLATVTGAARAPMAARPRPRLTLTHQLTCLLEALAHSQDLVQSTGLQGP
jgi:hypothetical protein